MKKPQVETEYQQAAVKAEELKHSMAERVMNGEDLELSWLISRSSYD